MSKEDFTDISKEKRQRLQPDRMAYAISELKKAGVFPEKKDDATIEFIFDSRLVKFFPFTGWASGKSIKDGRGLSNLIKQLI